MRRLLAITIALLFGLALAEPLFAVDSAGNLPACCRRDGRHHCGGDMGGIAANRTAGAIAPKCPNWPKSTAAPWPHTFSAEGMHSAGTPLFAHSTGAPQTEARYRIASGRSRQKRGPPVILL